MGLFESKAKKAERLYREGMRLLQESMMQQDLKQKFALEEFDKAARLGHLEAMYQYSLAGKESTNLDVRYSCRIYCEQAAGQGHVGALLACVRNRFDKKAWYNPARGREWIETARKLAASRPSAELDKAMETILLYDTPEGLLALAEQKENRDNRVTLLELAAEGGHPLALLRCGEAYRTGAHADPAAPEPMRAFLQFEKAAEQNGLARLAALWMAFHEPEALSCSPEKVLLWAKEHREEDPAAGYFWAREMDAAGKEGEVEPACRLRGYEWAAAQGLPGQTLLCAQLCAGGRGVPQDPAKAVRYYEKAMEEGSAAAAVGLGDLLRAGGPGLAADKARALETYKRAERWLVTGRSPKDEVPENEAAAVTGLARAGEMLLLGDGLAQNLAEGLALYHDAANGCVKIRPEAVSSAREAYKAGELGRAALELGRAYFNSGMEREALPLLRLAADDGAGYTSAMLPLAGMYQKGVPGALAPNPQQAGFWYRSWHRGLKPGDTVWFGAWPQEKGPYSGHDYRYLRGRFEPVEWNVLKTEPDRVLLLSRWGLKYALEGRDDIVPGWDEEYDTEKLFSPAELGLIGGPPFLLGSKEFEQYLERDGAADVRTSAVMKARSDRAVSAGMKVTFKPNGMEVGYNVSYTVYGDDTEEERRERKASRMESAFGGSRDEWLKLLTTWDSPWLLSYGAVVDGKYALPGHYETNRMALRLAVWVRLPQGPAEGTDA